MNDDPALPYHGGTDSGYSGSDTSRERAQWLDSRGITGKRQRAVMQALAAVKERGLTWREAADMLGVHHGAASGVLSNLHKTERIARLVDRRNKSRVYVLPEYVNDRPHDKAKANQRDPYFEAVLPVLAILLVCPIHQDEPDPWCRKCQAVETGFRTIRRYQREVQAQ